MAKQFLFGLVVGLGLIVAGGAGASRLSQKDIQRQRYQAELLGATPVQLGTLSERQRIHSKLYDDFSRHQGAMISELVTPYQNQGIVYGMYTNVNTPRLSAKNETPDNYFAALASQSDLVIRGEVTNRISQITEDGKFLFTDYDIRIEEVLKSDSNTLLSPGKTITVTFPGGKVLIGDVIVKTGGNGIPSVLEITNKVLIFAAAVPTSGAYKLARYDGGFEIDDASVRALAGDVPASYLENSKSFLKTVRAISNQ